MPPIADLALDRVADRLALWFDIDDIAPALTTCLPAANIHHRRTDIRALADSTRRIADEACRAAHEADVSVHREIAEKVHLLVEPLLAPLADAARNIL